MGRGKAICAAAAPATEAGEVLGPEQGQFGSYLLEQAVEGRAQDVALDLRQFLGPSLDRGVAIGVARIGDGRQK
ncbi:MAG: hypothetical protein HYZ28_17820 [Myxococcales bacterium]|nr:hypothetical protein [Myxococcales bacterium]